LGAAANAIGGASDFIGGGGMGDVMEGNNGMTDLEKEMMGLGDDAGIE